MNRIVRFVQLTRPLFLAGGVLAYCLGVIIAVREGHPFAPLPFLTGQIMVTFGQLMTHYVNEFYDQESDRRSSHAALPASYLSRPRSFCRHIGAVAGGILVFIRQ